MALLYICVFFIFQNDSEILSKIRADNVKKSKESIKENKSKMSKAKNEGPTIDKGHGTKMVLQQYFKWLDSEDGNTMKKVYKITESCITARHFFNSDID